MSSEYVRISKEEKRQGYKNLLHSQLEFLNLMRSFKNYKELRNKEFALKVSLKSRIGETFGEIEKFESLLPKTHMHEPIIKKKVENVKKEVKKKEPETLLDEANLIKEKLYRLQRGM